MSKNWGSSQVISPSCFTREYFRTLKHNCYYRVKRPKEEKRIPFLPIFDIFEYHKTGLKNFSSRFITKLMVETDSRMNGVGGAYRTLDPKIFFLRTFPMFYYFNFSSIT